MYMEFGCRELWTVYPYGLNDSVKGVGNVSKKSEGDELIVYTLFKKHDRKFNLRNVSGRGKEGR